MSESSEPGLERFLEAQGPIYPAVVEELRAGRKTSHWMWFIFPQMRGLGRSPASDYFGMSGLNEAKRYLAHPVLGARLQECCKLVLSHPGTTAHEIFGYPDELKLKSSMTLFDQASEASDNVFRRVLERFYQGASDPGTLSLLRAGRAEE